MISPHDDDMESVNSVVSVAVSANSEDSEGEEDFLSELHVIWQSKIATYSSPELCALKNILTNQLDGFIRKEIKYRAQQDQLQAELQELLHKFYQKYPFRFWYNPDTHYFYQIQRDNPVLVCYDDIWISMVRTLPTNLPSRHKTTMSGLLRRSLQKEWNIWKYQPSETMLKRIDSFLEDIFTTPDQKKYFLWMIGATLHHKFPSEDEYHLWLAPHRSSANGKALVELMEKLKEIIYEHTHIYPHILSKIRHFYSLAVLGSSLEQVRYLSFKNGSGHQFVSLLKKKSLPLLLVAYHTYREEPLPEWTVPCFPTVLKLSSHFHKKAIWERYQNRIRVEDSGDWLHMTDVYDDFRKFEKEESLWIPSNLFNNKEIQEWMKQSYPNHVKSKLIYTGLRLQDIPKVSFFTTFCQQYLEFTEERSGTFLHIVYYLFIRWYRSQKHPLTTFQQQEIRDYLETLYPNKKEGTLYPFIRIKNFDTDRMMTFFFKVMRQTKQFGLLEDKSQLEKAYHLFTEWYQEKKQYRSYPCLEWIEFRYYTSYALKKEKQLEEGKDIVTNVVQEMVHSAVND